MSGREIFDDASESDDDLGTDLFFWFFYSPLSNNTATVSLDPHTDPSTLCPYCDLPLPLTPTPHLQKLLKNAAAHPRSRPDNRPSNPLGRRAPLIVFINVCQRHQFENVWLPKARLKGWKEEIEWKALSGRVGRLREQLGRILGG